jgi:hypothetical protein
MMNRMMRVNVHSLTIFPIRRQGGPTKKAGAWGAGLGIVGLLGESY